MSYGIVVVVLIVLLLFFSLSTSPKYGPRTAVSAVADPASRTWRRVGFFISSSLEQTYSYHKHHFTIPAIPSAGHLSWGDSRQNPAKDGCVDRTHPPQLIPRVP